MLLRPCFYHRPFKQLSYVIPMVWLSVDCVIYRLHNQCSVENIEDLQNSQTFSASPVPHIHVLQPTKLLFMLQQNKRNDFWTSDIKTNSFKDPSCRPYEYTFCNPGLRSNFLHRSSSVAAFNMCQSLAPISFKNNFCHMSLFYL